MAIYFRENTHCHLVNIGLTAEVSRTDGVFLFLVQKGQMQFISLRISVPTEGGLLGCTGSL